MEPCQLKDIAKSCNASLGRNFDDLEVTAVCTDTRLLTPGCLFVALRGERFDGHDYAEEAVSRGAVALLVETEVVAPGAVAQLRVKDTRKSLGEIAAMYRGRFGLPICAVAGSNGKTTTKELVASVLSQKFETLKSPASFNNDIGVPLTLLRTESKHEAAVLEVGTNHPGELENLLRMVRPKYGVLTNIGHEHLEFFGSIENVAQEEGAIAEFVPADGALFLNADTPFSKEISGRCQSRVVTVGFADNAEWKVGECTLDAEGVEFELLAPSADFSGTYRVNLIGQHQAVNAAFAVALGAELGLDAGQIRRGLADCRPGSMRMEKAHVLGASVLVDCYNANLDSMKASLQTLAAFPCAGRRIAVLGDMAELGGHSGPSHFETGRIAGGSGIDLMLVLGDFAESYLKGAGEAGFADCKVFSSVETVSRFLKAEIRPGDVVLLKASRAVNLERVLKQLRETD